MANRYKLVAKGNKQSPTNMQGKKNIGINCNFEGKQWVLSTRIAENNNGSIDHYRSKSSLCLGKGHTRSYKT